jgi:hypothetical protein
VTVDFTGGAAAEAVKVGKVKIATAMAAGRPLELLSIEPDSFGEVEHGFVPIDRSARDFVTKEPSHPEGGVRLRLRYAKVEKDVGRVERLAGTVSMQTIDPAQIVTMENVGSRLSGSGVIQLKHPKLDAIGQFSLTVNSAGRARLVVKGFHMPDFDVRFLDGRGRLATGGGGRTSIGDETTRYVEYTIDKALLDHARLEIVLGYRTLDVPFAFSNIAVRK